jgi:hypothetical protein
MLDVAPRDYPWLKKMLQKKVNKSISPLPQMGWPTVGSSFDPSVYVMRVLRQVHPDTRMLKEASRIVVDFVCEWLAQLVSGNHQSEPLLSV